MRNINIRKQAYIAWYHEINQNSTFQTQFWFAGYVVMRYGNGDISKIRIVFKL